MTSATGPARPGPEGLARAARTGTTGRRRQLGPGAELFRDLGDRHGQAWALDLGAVQRLTGDYPAAAASLTQALQLSRDLGDRHGQAWALDDLGVVQQLTGDYPAATASLTQALQLFRDLGRPAAAKPGPSTTWAWCSG